MVPFAAAAFAAGLLGGVHCVGMCGGIVGALSAGSRGALWRRLAAFNAGRIASYACAGAAAGALGALATGPVLLKTILFVAAQAMVIAIGCYVAGWNGLILRFERAGGALWRRIEPLRRHFFPIDSDARALGAGAVWGWLPCGLVYGMLPLSAVSGGALAGAAIMAAFGLGTLPGLVAAGAAARALSSWRRQPWVRRLAGLAIVAVGIAGLARVPGANELIAAGWNCLG